MAIKAVENSDIKKEEVRLNKLPYSAIFDTASTVNLISPKIVKELRILPKPTKKVIKIQLLNKTKVNLNESVILSLEYKNRCIETEFYILYDGIVDLLIN